VARDLSQGTGRRERGVFKSRVHSLHLGYAILQSAQRLSEIAQLLGYHLVVIHA
jgi:hypothetical protein